MEESGLGTSGTPSFSDAFGTSGASTASTASTPSPLDTFDDALGSGAESSYSIWSVISFILIILIVWVIIFNVFDLGRVTEWLGSVLKFIGYSTGETIKTTADVGAAGVVGSTSVAAGAVTGGIDMLEKGLNLTPEEKARAEKEKEFKKYIP